MMKKNQIALFCIIMILALNLSGCVSDNEENNMLENLKITIKDDDGKKLSNIPIYFASDNEVSSGIEFLWVEANMAGQTDSSGTFTVTESDINDIDIVEENYVIGAAAWGYKGEPRDHYKSVQRSGKNNREISFTFETFDKWYKGISIDWSEYIPSNRIEDHCPVIYYQTITYDYDSELLTAKIKNAPEVKIDNSGFSKNQFGITIEIVGRSNPYGETGSPPALLWSSYSESIDTEGVEYIDDEDMGIGIYNPIEVSFYKVEDYPYAKYTFSICEVDGNSLVPVKSFETDVYLDHVGL